MYIRKKQGKEERKYNVLGHIVQLYVSTASPVSSKVVAQRMGGNISSATIRNIMADLEEEGYIEQPHTSAGRIPTNSGYRGYVNMVKDHLDFQNKESKKLAHEYTEKVRTIKEIIEKTSYLISRELHNASVVMWPSIMDSYLKQIELVKIKSETVLAIVVTMANAVNNYIIRLDADQEKNVLQRTANYINENFEYDDLTTIADKIRMELEEEAQDSDETAIKKQAFGIISSIMEEDIENEIYWEGLSYFMEELEARDIEFARDILRMFSERRSLIRLMSKELPHREVKVYIGEESNCDMMKNCSMITSGYTLRGKTVGRIGVIGPTRMDYRHALWMMNCLSDVISDKLNEINE